MADPRWPPFENMTLFGFHMTSSAGVVDLKGNLFKFRFHSLNILRYKKEGAESHGPRKPKTARSGGPKASFRSCLQNEF